MRPVLVYRTIFFTWLAWAVLMLGLVQYLPARFSLTVPDRALSWTAEMTSPGSQSDRPYLNHPFLNGHVAWDSEYYLSIAQNGYRDPAIEAIPADFSWKKPVTRPFGESPTWTPISHAFFPGYPLMMRLVTPPFLLLGMESQQAATLAGVLISLVATLAAMVALYRLGQDMLNQRAGMRAAFYLLLTPASMFLAMVYSDGLFLALSFSALMFARERRFLPGGSLAFLAALTRPAGALLLLPLFLYWYGSDSRRLLFRGAKGHHVGELLFMLAPAAAYGFFLVAMGREFHFLENNYFSRSLLNLRGTLIAWREAVGMMAVSRQSLAYYSVELACLIAALVSLFWMLRRDRILALYGAAVLILSVTSGAAQGMHRYVLAIPSLFLAPADLGRHQWFDRSWIMLNLPLMIILLTLFVFDHWAG